MTELRGSSSLQGPLLTVFDPEGTERERVELSGERLSVGRLPNVNDLALEPDPDQLVTRKEHCVFARSGSRWLLADGGSANGTFMRRAGQLVQVESETELDHGDVVCIVGRWERKRPRYWELVYSDTTRTRAVNLAAAQLQLVYVESTRRLVLRSGGEQHELALRPQGHKLVLHIARRNSDVKGDPVLCSHDELMEAVWGNEPFHTRNDLARLFWELRKKLEPYGAGDLVEAARGLGYRVAVTLA